MNPLLVMFLTIAQALRMWVFGLVLSGLGNTTKPPTNKALLNSLSKQALSTVLKSVIIYPSPDPRDVTAYVNGPFQLARKGRRPLPATLATYREQIRLRTEAMKVNTPGPR